MKKWQDTPVTLWLRRHYTAVWLLLLTSIYLVATLPYLNNFPIIETAQIGIVAPAHKLATQGIYGNDLYRGLYNAENRNYEYLPLYPLTVALSFKLLGTGIWQARLVSVICGFFVLLLTFVLGKITVGRLTGLLAATSLCLLSVTVTSTSAGDLYPGQMPLLDFARVLRYDIMVPVWVLAASILFFWSYNRNNLIGYLGVGICVGLATLSHMYGVFILSVFVLVLLWQEGWTMGRQRPLYLMFIGLFITILPWIGYILQDLSAYQGQILRHDSRFDFLNIHFYLNNLLQEPWRYVKFFGRFRPPILWPRPGLWMMMFTVFAGYYSLWQQLRTQPSVHSRFLTLTLPFLVLCLAIVVSFKRFAYIALILPFLMLQAGLGIAFIWHRLGQKRKLWQAVFFIALLLTFGEGIWGIVRTLHTAAGTMPYTTLVKTLQQNIPIGSRILMMHNYWLGMMDYDVYSIDLAYNLSDPNFTGTNARPLAQVIQQMEPNYIIVPQHLLKSYIENSEGLPNDKVYNLWRSLDMYIQQYCPVEVAHIETTAYGTITTYHCP